MNEQEQQSAPMPGASADMRIFGPIFDGMGPVYVDPIKVSRLLSDLLDGDPKKALEAMQGPAPELRLEATNKVYRAVVLAFELVPFDKQTKEGLREDEIFAILADFLSWRQQQRRFFAKTPTSPVSTGPASSPCPPVPASACG